MGPCLLESGAQAVQQGTDQSASFESPNVSPTQATEQTFDIVCRDGFVLEGRIALPRTDEPVRVLREQEARYPRSAEILAGAEFKVAFFQGMWDNQTPAYNTMAVELASRFVWGKDSFRFFYFDGLGHALDARTEYGDLRYDTIDAEAKSTVALELDSYFRNGQGSETENQ